MDEGGATPSNGPDAYTRCKGLCVLCGHSQLSLRLCAGPLQSSDGDLSVLPVPSPCPPTRCLRAHTLLPLPMTYSELVLPSLPCPVRRLETLTASTTVSASRLLPVPSRVWRLTRFSLRFGVCFVNGVHSSAPPEPPAATC